VNLERTKRLFSISIHRACAPKLQVARNFLFIAELFLFIPCARHIFFQRSSISKTQVSDMVHSFDWHSTLYSQKVLIVELDWERRRQRWSYEIGIDQLEWCSIINYLELRTRVRTWFVFPLHEWDPIPHSILFFETSSVDFPSLWSEGHIAQIHW